MVRSFDEDRGLGTVAEDGGGEYPFHCTAIADGTRRIDVGVHVVFEVAPGHGGRFEARSLTPVRVSEAAPNRALLPNTPTWRRGTWWTWSGTARSG